MTSTLPAIVTEPGIYDGIPDAVYHADPVPGGSLSNSGARKLLAPSCPARYAYEREHPPASRPDFDFGHAAHRLTLGTGLDIAVIDAPDWRTKAAKEQRDAAYAAGRAPMLTGEYARAQAMVTALRQHPLAAALLDPATGRAEQSAFWVDEQAGIWRRARYDWLRDQAGGRVIVVDYKTTDSADPDHIRRAIHNHGYYQQDPWYLDGIKALDVADDPAFLFVFQEKAAPYLVTVVELDEYDRAAGRDRNRRAIDVYARCVATGEWPGYASDILPISLPAWAHRTEEQ